MKWEYTVLSVKSGMLESDEPLETTAQGSSVGSDQLQSALGHLGGQGWEAFNTVFDSKGAITKVILKRAKG